MVSVSKRIRSGAGVPATPRQAARRRCAVDRELDPGLFKALSDPTRLALLSCLIKCDRACSVSEVAECCLVDFSVVARHLALLARAGVLESRKEGRTVWYRARSGSLAGRLRELADAIEVCCRSGAGCRSDRGCGSDRECRDGAGRGESGASGAGCSAL